MLGTKPRTSWILSRHSNEPNLQVKIWISYKQQMTFSISTLYTILGTNLNKLLLWCWLKIWFNWKIHILPDDRKRKTKSLWKNERLIMVESKYWSNEKGLKFDKGSLKVIKNLIISHQHWEELCGQHISWVNLGIINTKITNIYLVSLYCNSCVSYICCHSMGKLRWRRQRNHINC